jgi:hypothetical protein
VAAATSLTVEAAAWQKSDFIGGSSTSGSTAAARRGGGSGGGIGCAAAEAAAVTKLEYIGTYLWYLPTNPT